MPGAYYSISVVDFLKKSSHDILTNIKAQGDDSDQQEFAWKEEIKILMETLKNFNRGHLIFEYEIPRMRKRIDVVLIYSGIIFVLEFKVNKPTFAKLDAEQCMDYALDLKYFHKQSHERYIVPILIPTDAKSEDQIDVKTNLEPHYDKVFDVIHTHQDNLENIVNRIKDKYSSEHDLDPYKWMNSKYYPTPTIIEAAQTLYHKHQVSDIGTPEDSKKLERLVEKLNAIITDSKEKKQKSVCFVTGIPGSGKTLAGLNLLSSRRDLKDGTHSIFLSGNGALVTVLRGALIADTRERTGEKKKDVERPVKAFIQHMRDYRNDFLNNPNEPMAEEIVVFDEAQRAWTKNKLSRKLEKNHNYNKSEPALVLDILAKHKDWATLICLVGGGQEIHDGEIGLWGWFEAILERKTEWKVYLSENIKNNPQMKDRKLDEHLDALEYKFDDDLHLDRSLRSFKNKSVSKFINHLMDSADSPNTTESKKMLEEFDEQFPIRITRDINTAKEWLRSKARGSERYGIIAHHNSYRLKPYGVCLNSDLDVERWFLDKSNSIFSAYYMEEIASEFETQGLELDWTCVCWDANLRYNDGWVYNKFWSRDWRKIKNNNDQMYLRNSYRVLLTRARQGTVIFVPHGDLDDRTRNPEYYGGVYNYLKSMGIKEVESVA